MKLKKDKSDAVKIAERMEEDYIFNFFIKNEIVERITKGLRIVAVLSTIKPDYQRRGRQQQSIRKLRQYKFKIIYWVLQCLEATKNITSQQ
ncbi:hypothetical protein IBX38_07510 [Candidatus Bathyarchaeota archaeon]|nr:hypothetical protein [Candidatus Bathyarchaeota archaeon]